MQKTQSPLLRLWQLGREHHGGLIAAIFCAVVVSCWGCCRISQRGTSW